MLADYPPIVDRLHAELARVMELRQQTEQELQAIRGRVLAQEKLATLGKLAACAAHEINQPLFYLKIFCESFCREAESGALPLPGLVEEAREACRQIERIHKLTRQILCYGRPESEPHTQQDVPSALERAFILMRPQLKRLSVKLSVRVDAEYTLVLGGATMLEQLFINLLQNSIDAQTNQAEKKIQIRFVQQNRNLVIILRDNGPGIPEAIQEMIFESFFTTKTCGQGTGLGLAIVLDIVRAHQGTIRLTSKKKRGTEFTIKLPLMQNYADRCLSPDAMGRQAGLTEPQISVVADSNMSSQ